VQVADVQQAPHCLNEALAWNVKRYHNRIGTRVCEERINDLGRTYLSDRISDDHE
jgi:hypothetical protein